MEKRTLGSTGVELSAVGFGGVVVGGMTHRDAEAWVDEALDAGINYFDVAPTYGDAETRLGPALYGNRDDVFLACKTTERTKDGARRELEQSLENLRTDHFDLYQAHAVNTLEDVEMLFGPNGGMETFFRAKDDGKTRFLGFSAHSEEAALAMMDRFDFDTILFPVNYVCWFEGGFGPRAIERARENDMGLLGIKATARQKWPEGADRQRYPKCWYEPEDDERFARLALRFAWSQGITACVPPGDPGLWRMAAHLAQQGAQPLSHDELAELRLRAVGKDPIFASAVAAER